MARSKEYKNDSDGGKVVTFAEHLTPPIVTFVLRKLVLGLVYGNLSVLRQVSRVYGFDFSGSVSDRESWCWSLREKLPLYTAKVEKVD